MFHENAWKYIPGGTKDTPPEVIEAETRKLTPLDHCGLPEDISNVVRFLVHPQAGWINGVYPHCFSTVWQSLLTMQNRANGHNQRRSHGLARMVYMHPELIG